ncbi:FHA domain-containing protein FhaB/FipA [Salinibacterium soli]|uniref:FHA domain-containing protein n=1 Tax=Antiquaquibacter soli TaxID=3064523 RepID=A0ABT9BSA3_9MICO|nr:FHA domain-containing protein [Protaetiibacter sp. WY-16]MDO7883509.1 FHA domain-containing protein [Protaetiibacter sp. WY-16]
MSELTLLLLRIAFLAVLWAFVFAIVYALRSDLFGQKVRRMPAPAATPQAAAPAAAPRSAAPAPRPAATPQGPVFATRLVITSGAKEGLEIDLPDEQLTIGRSSDSGLVIRDDYTSTHHARLLKWPDGWVVQDLDSTNGTFLDGNRVIMPTVIPLNTPVRIGTTSFELRR